MATARYAKVTAVVWVDLEMLQRNDLGFDLGVDLLEDARYYVHSQLDGVSCVVALRTEVAARRRAPKSER